MNDSVVILILKYSKPSVLAAGLESDAVWKGEWGNNAIMIFSQEHFWISNSTEKWKCLHPTDPFSPGTAGESGEEVEYLMVIWIRRWMKAAPGQLCLYVCACVSILWICKFAQDPISVVPRHIERIQECVFQRLRHTVKEFAAAP